MKKVFLLIKILIIYLLLISNVIAKQQNYLNKGIELFQKKEFAKSKIIFEKDIVFDPKSEKSYLYLAKIFPFIVSFFATWDQPPGQEPKSNNDNFFFKNLNFLFISINLKADLDLNPWILDCLKNGSFLCFANQLFEILFFFKYLIQF